tara:strand:+ start:28 stop:579 length:552 start_codon:yes stop_codon:yes gene_type:complete
MSEHITTTVPRMRACEHTWSLLISLEDNKYTNGTSFLKTFARLIVADECQPHQGPTINQHSINHSKVDGAPGSGLKSRNFYLIQSFVIEYCGECSLGLPKFFSKTKTTTKLLPSSNGITTPYPEPAKTILDYFWRHHGAVNNPSPDPIVGTPHLNPKAIQLAESLFAGSNYEVSRKLRGCSCD